MTSPSPSVCASNIFDYQVFNDSFSIPPCFPQPIPVIDFTYATVVENFIEGFSSPCPDPSDNVDQYTGDVVKCTDDGSQHGRVIYLRDVGYLPELLSLSEAQKRNGEAAQYTISLIVSSPYSDFPYAMPPLFP